MDSTKPTLKAICPIYGLGWVLSDLKITNNITLRFVNDFNNEGDELSAVGLRKISYRCVLDISLEHDPKDYSTDPWLEIQMTALNVEAALRVYHEGKIGVAAVIYFEDGQRGSATILDSFIPNGQEDYKIKKEELNLFPEFFTRFTAAYTEKPVAFQYFSRAQRRATRNDVAIDLCTSLENLFVPRNSRGAKKVFLLQGAKIMGFDSEQVQMISDLYDYRNVIVHGDHNERAAIYTKKRGNYTGSWFEKCENLVREILLKYTARPWQ